MSVMFQESWKFMDFGSMDWFEGAFLTGSHGIVSMKYGGIRQISNQSIEQKYWKPIMLLMAERKLLRVHVQERDYFLHSSQNAPGMTEWHWCWVRTLQVTDSDTETFVINDHTWHCFLCAIFFSAKRKVPTHLEEYLGSKIGAPQS